MHALLAAYPRCQNYRNKIALGQKIFDMAEFSEGERFIILDSDLLFFARPDSVLDWVENQRDECRFIRDVAEASNVSAAEAEARFKITLWPCINSGLCLLPKAAIDLDFCEKCLGETTILNGHVWRVEQTLFALCASRYGRGQLLPHTYEVSLSSDCQHHATARHYVGQVRNLFYAEGLPRVYKLLLAD